MAQQIGRLAEFGCEHTEGRNQSPRSFLIGSQLEARHAILPPGELTLAYQQEGIGEEFHRLLQQLASTQQFLS